MARARIRHLAIQFTTQPCEKPVIVIAVSQSNTFKRSDVLDETHLHRCYSKLQLARTTVHLPPKRTMTGLDKSLSHADRLHVVSIKLNHVASKNNLYCVKIV